MRGGGEHSVGVCEGWVGGCQEKRGRHSSRWQGRHGQGRWLGDRGRAGGQGDRGLEGQGQGRWLGGQGALGAWELESFVLRQSV